MDAGWKRMGRALDWIEKKAVQQSDVVSWVFDLLWFKEKMRLEKGALTLHFAVVTDL